MGGCEGIKSGCFYSPSTGSSMFGDYAGVRRESRAETDLVGKEERNIT